MQKNMKPRGIIFCQVKASIPRKPFFSAGTSAPSPAIAAEAATADAAIRWAGRLDKLGREDLFACCWKGEVVCSREHPRFHFFPITTTNRSQYGITRNLSYRISNRHQMNPTRSTTEKVSCNEIDIISKWSAPKKRPLFHFASHLCK